MGNVTIKDNILESSKTKKLDDLLSKKKTNTNNKDEKADSNGDMRQKMNRIVGANRVFENKNSNIDFSMEDSEELKKLVEEKKKIEKELKDANKKLKSIYNLKYDDLKIIDKSKNELSLDFVTTLENAKQLNELDKQKEDIMNEELDALQKEIRALQENNLVAKKSFDDATQAANLAQEAALRACDAFREKERSSNRSYKEEIIKLTNQLNNTKNELEKSNNDRNHELEKIKQLEFENNTTKDTIKQLEDKIKKSETDNSNLLKKISLCNEESKQLKLDNSSLLKKIQKQENDIISKTEYTKNIKKIEKLNEELTNLKTTSRTLQSEINKNKTILDKAMSDKDNALENYKLAKKDLQSANNNIKKLENKIVLIENARNQKNDELIALNKKYTLLEENNKNNIEKIKSLHDLKTKYSELTKQYNELQNNPKVIIDESMYKEYEAEIAALNEKLEDSKVDEKKFNLLQSDYDELKQSYEEINELKNKEYEEKINSLNDQLKVIQVNNEKISILQSDYDKLKQLYEDLKNNTDDKNTINELQSELEKKQSDYLLLKQSYKELNDSKNNEYENQIIDLNKQITDLNNELIITNNKIIELSKKNTKAEQEVESLKKQLDLVNPELDFIDTNQLSSEKDAILKVKIFENKQLPIEDQKSFEEIKQEIDERYKNTQLNIIQNNKSINTNEKDKDYDSIIDNLYVQLDNKDEEINNLTTSNQKLFIDNAQIGELKQRIEELQNAINSNNTNDKVLSDEIDPSIFKEFQELQNEFDKTEEQLEILKQKKEEVEDELKASFDALRDQNEIVNQQQEIINKQQFIIDQKLVLYKVQEEYYNEQKTLFKKYKESYDKDKIEFEEQKEIAEERKNVIYKSEYTIDEYQSKLVDLKRNLDESLEEIEILKEEQVKQKKIIKQYLFDIETSEKALADYTSTVNEKEKEIVELRNKLDEMTNQYDQLSINKDNEISKLQEELNKIKQNINVITSDSEKLEMSKFNESRLQSRIFELENNLKMVTIKQDSTEDKTIRSSLDQYRSLLENERKAHVDSENNLTNDLNKLRSKVDEIEDKLIKFTGNYMLTNLNNQINILNSIISEIKDNGNCFNRDIYNDYYEEAIRIYYEQRKVYNREIDKRNDLLNIIKNDLENEIEVLSHEKNSIESGRVKEYNKQVKEINNLLNSSIKSYTPVDSKVVEEEILRNFKKELIAYHKQMEDNINLLEHHIDEKYNNIKSIDTLIDVYKNDYDEMARRYANEIMRLDTENKFDNNEFTKLIREEKIIMLSSEFENLVLIRDKKYNETLTVLEQNDIDDLSNEYNQSLDSFKSLKENLSLKLDSLRQEEENAKQLLFEEENHTNEDIDSLNAQLTRLENFSDDEDVIEDKRKVSVLLAGKKERLDYLKNVKIIEISKYYDELIDGIKKEYADVINEENGVKEAYLKRQNLMNISKKMTLNQENSNNRINGISNLNKYLLDLNSIDGIISSIIIKRRTNNPILIENEKNTSQDALVKYQNLWKLFDKYNAVKKVMEEDFEDIRAYNAFKLEASGCYRKYVSSVKELNLVEERNKAGLDLDKNDETIKVLTLKTNNYKARVDYLNNEATQLMNNNNVNEYVELINKIEQIVNIIKQLGFEINKL